MSKRSPAIQQNPPAPPANAGDDPIIFNPVSKWQEYVEVPGLTLFDIHREPRRVNEDPTARARLQLKVRAHPLMVAGIGGRWTNMPEHIERHFPFSHVC
jgi:hypothetical protein